MTQQEAAEALAQFSYEDRCAIFEAAHDIAPQAHMVTGIKMSLRAEDLSLTRVLLAKRIREVSSRVVYNLKGALDVADALLKGEVLIHEFKVGTPVSSDHFHAGMYRWAWDMSDLAQIKGLKFEVHPVLSDRLDARSCWPSPTA